MRKEEKDLTIAVTCLIDGLFIIGGGFYDGDKFHQVCEMEMFLDTFKKYYPQIEKSWAYEYFYDVVKPEVNKELKEKCVVGT